MRLKAVESRHAVEEVLYIIILFKFSEIKVPLVPCLSQCLYNDRLEILPSKDWELESIHSPEVLKLVREHLTDIFGWRVGSSVTANWSTFFKADRMIIQTMYEHAILYGYFLKSVSLRLRLEQNLPMTYKNISFGDEAPIPFGSDEVEKVFLGQSVTSRSPTLSRIPSMLGKKEYNLKSYISSFDEQAHEECGKLKTDEACNIFEKHCSALFASDQDVISTSLSSLKRLVLEAIAFGCFLWDAEEYVSSIYKLHPNVSKDRY